MSTAHWAIVKPEEVWHKLKMADVWLQRKNQYLLKSSTFTLLFIVFLLLFKEFVLADKLAFAMQTIGNCGNLPTIKAIARFWCSNASLYDQFCVGTTSNHLPTSFKVNTDSSLASHLSVVITALVQICLDQISLTVVLVHLLSLVLLAQFPVF